MTNPKNSPPGPLLLMIAGAKGAVASTVAVAVAAMRKNPQAVLPSLTTHNRFPYSGSPQAIFLAGWDIEPAGLADCIEAHGVLPESIWKPFETDIDTTVVKAAPAEPHLNEQIEHLMQDMSEVKNEYTDAIPVLINLLPAER